MVIKNVIRTFACSSVVLCSMVLNCHAGSAYTRFPSTTAPRYVSEMGAPLVNTVVSLTAQAPVTWKSILYWILCSLAVVAAVLLVLWACVSSATSLLPELPGGKKPVSDRTNYRIKISDIGKTVLPNPSSISNIPSVASHS